MRWSIKKNKIQPIINEPQYKNPLFNKKYPELLMNNLEIYIYLLIFLIILIIYILFYSPIFTINEIEFKKLQNISQIVNLRD